GLSSQTDRGGKCVFAGNLGSLSKAEFLERVRRSNQACQQGDFGLAVRLYSEALNADPQNCILYSNRSAAYLRLGQYGTALDDAVKARLINPKWPKVGGSNPVSSDQGSMGGGSLRFCSGSSEFFCTLSPVSIRLVFKPLK
uniref:Uncharacterized protein n=1 Tax=Oryzias melastigma TaxID=30732 RepID=A0A3B3E1G5_ORYME